MDSYIIRGVTHNINFMRSARRQLPSPLTPSRAVCDHPDFIAGRINTYFIPSHYPQGFKVAGWLAMPAWVA